MQGWWGISVSVFALSLVWASGAYAQSRSDGYDKPEVEINRSVLQELKDYTPPPMFGSNAPPAQSDAPLTSPPAPAPSAPPAPKIKVNGDDDVKRDVKVEAKGNGRKTYTITNTTKSAKSIAAPPRPTLTAPKAEDILSHPVENFHVLTIQQPALTQPDPKAVLPVPKTATAKNENKNSGERLTIIPPPPKKQKIAPPMLPPAAYTNTKPRQKAQTAAMAPPPSLVATTPPKAMPKVTPKPYVPKTAKSMPAVGAVKVEKTPLPPSPVAPLAPPTSTDKLLDAALETHMVEDKAAVTGAVIAKPEKKAKAKAKAKDDKKVTTDASEFAVFSLAFGKTATDLSADQKATIKGNAISLLKKDSKKRVSILAYASSGDDDESAARRISLARALSVRQYLVDNNIPPARIDLKALGNATTTTPKDRVDMKVK